MERLAESLIMSDTCNAARARKRQLAAVVEAAARDVIGKEKWESNQSMSEKEQAAATRVSYTSVKLCFHPRAEAIAGRWLKRSKSNDFTLIFLRAGKNPVPKKNRVTKSRVISSVYPPLTLSSDARAPPASGIPACGSSQWRGWWCG
eukprot:6187771-Pleurochrysis_carterae.AAC.2